MAQNIDQVFRQLGRTEKARFIEKNLEYASEQAIAEFVDTYFLGVARHLPIETLEAMLHSKEDQNKSNEAAGNYLRTVLLRVQQAHHSWGAGRGKASVRTSVHSRTHGLPQGDDPEGIHRPLYCHRGNERHEG